MTPWRKFVQRPLVIGVLVSTFVALSIIGVRSAGSLMPLELAAYDWGLRLRPGASGPDPRLVLIGVTENDIRALGWPISDAALAKALDILTQFRPRAIGLDIYRDFPVPPGREDLEAILTKNRRIITVMKFGDGEGLSVPAPPILNNTDQVGFNDILIDSDGIVRRGLLLLDDGEKTAYSFALRLALLYLAAEGITPQPDAVNPQHLRLGQVTLQPLEANDGGYVGADARGYQILIDYQGARTRLPFFSLSSLLAAQIDPQAINGKIVLIGVMAESVNDLFYTPYSRGLQAAQQMPGIVLHAHIVSQLLRSGLENSVPVATASDTQEAVWVLLWGLLGGTLGSRVRSPLRLSLLGASGLLILGLAVYFAFLVGWWTPFVPPAMAWLISAGLVTAFMANQEKKLRGLTMQLFARHVSPEVAETIWRQRDQFLDGGRLRSQKLMVTTLFTDLAGFSKVSEKTDPQVLMDWLNTYMETISNCVMEHGGVVDDYFGDGMKADFGAPVPRSTEAEIRQDAMNAVNCALAMEREMLRLNTVMLERNLPVLRMRVGIYTGPVVAGSLGSTERLKYTTLGDTVNIASRLESFDKDLAIPNLESSPCRILIGESTMRYLDSQFHIQRVGETSLKGKDEKITIFRVVGRIDQTTHGVRQEEQR